MSSVPNNLNPEQALVAEQQRLEAIIQGYNMCREGKSIAATEAALAKCIRDQIVTNFWRKMQLVLDSVVLPKDIHKQKEPIQLLLELNAFSRRPVACQQIQSRLPALDWKDEEVMKTFLDYEQKAKVAVTNHIAKLLGPFKNKAVSDGKVLPLWSQSQSGKKTKTTKYIHKDNAGMVFFSFDIREANWTAIQALCEFKQEEKKAWIPYVTDLIRPIFSTWKLGDLDPSNHLVALLAHSKEWRQLVIGRALKQTNMYSKVEQVEERLLNDAWLLLGKEWQEQALPVGHEEFIIQADLSAKDWKGSVLEQTKTFQKLLPSHIKVQPLLINAPTEHGFDILNLATNVVVCKNIDNNAICRDFLKSRFQKPAAAAAAGVEK